MLPWLFGADRLACTGLRDLLVQSSVVGYAKGYVVMVDGDQARDPRRTRVSRTPGIAQG